MTDYTAEATALFTRIAARHGLTHEVGKDAPVEVLWGFPLQAKLSAPITLALQNADELNFGVGEFWSYFFPYPTVAAEFERLVDAWIDGDARVITGFWSVSLQLRDGDSWRTVYRAGQLFPRRRRSPPLFNRAAG